MVQPKNMLVVIPSRLGVGEAFALKVRVLGEVVEITSVGQWNTMKPALRGPPDPAGV